MGDQNVVAVGGVHGDHFRLVAALQALHQRTRAGDESVGDLHRPFAAGAFPLTDQSFQPIESGRIGAGRNGAGPECEER